MSSSSSSSPGPSSNDSHTSNVPSNTSYRSASKLAFLPQHVIRQVKFLVPGGVTVYLLGVWNELYTLLSTKGWGRIFAWITLAQGVLSIALFMSVLMSPLIWGVKIDFRNYRKSGFLSYVIPILTISLVGGWLTGIVALGQYSNLGYLKGTVGVCGLYLLSLGTLGLFPAPAVKRH